MLEEIRLWSLYLAVVGGMQGAEIEGTAEVGNLVAQYLSYANMGAKEIVSHYLLSEGSIWCSSNRAYATIEVSRGIWCAFSFVHSLALRLRADDNFCRIWVFVCLRPRPGTPKKGAFKSGGPQKKEAGCAKTSQLRLGRIKFPYGYTLGRRPLQVRRVSKVSRRASN